MSADNLTGVWHGLYTYPSRGTRTLFDATLIESAAFLTGTTHEIATSGAMKGQMIFAQLDGERRGASVTFNKTYDAGIQYYSARIRYDGVLAADGTEIEGRWAISSSWSGKFLMIRSTGKEMAVEHKVFERI